MSSQSFIEKIFRAHGLEHFGLVPLETPSTLNHYVSWLQNGYAATMDYLAEQLEERSSPKSFFPQARSSFVVAIPYLSHPNQKHLSHLPVAIYAQGKDYHNWVRRRLEAIVKDLSQEFPNEEFLCFADSAPIMERDLAHRAGIGWVGKNSCLINEQIGSFFFIGEIYTTLEMEMKLDVPVDRCGTCTRCIDICPTDAFVEPRVLDATKCLSYWTIEARDEMPIPIRTKSSWYFGCDLCQTVCPWNSKPLQQVVHLKESKWQWGVPGRATMEDQMSENRNEVVTELRDLLNSSNSQIEKRFERTALMRAKAHHHRNNALTLIAYYKLHELTAEVTLYLEKPRHKVLAQWTLEQLQTPNQMT
ncbi:MAG: tRNA epoxyqueuosine(34) reductase QueG [Bdellovibrionales bacterium]